MFIRAEVTWTTRQVITNIKKGRMKFDNAVQRGYTWTASRKGLFIRTMIVDYLTSNFIARRLDGTVWDMLEGQQRSITAYKYVNGEFPIEISEKKFSTEFELESGEVYDYNGKYFEELPEEIQERILDYTFSVTYFDGMTDEEAAEQFYLINNGQALNSSQQMWALVQNPAMLQELGEHKFFKETMSETALEKYSYRSIIMQAFVIYKSETKSFERKDMTAFLQSTDVTEEDKEKMLQILDLMHEVYEKVNDMALKKISRKMTNKTHFVSMIPVVERAIEDNLTAEDIANWFLYFFGVTDKTSISNEYNMASSNSTAKKINVQRRIEAVNKAYDEYFKEGKRRSLSNILKK